MAKITKYARKSRQERAAARKAAQPAPTLKNLKARLAALPRFGESKKEIAKLQARIAEMDT